MKLPKRHKYCANADEVFRKVYLQALNKQRLIKHPSTPMMEQKHWKTICYNFASLAADAFEGRTLVVDGVDLMPK